MKKNLQKKIITKFMEKKNKNISLKKITEKNITNKISVKKIICKISSKNN